MASSTRQRRISIVVHITVWLTATVVVPLATAYNANGFLEDLLKNAKDATQIRDRLEPLRLDNVTLKKFIVYDISIHNLLNMRRQGTAVFSNQLYNVTMDAGLAFHEVLVRASVRRRRRRQHRVLRGLTVNIDALLEKLVAKIRVHCNVLTGWMAVSMFEVRDLGPLRVTRLAGTGAALFDRIAQKIAQRILIDRNRAKIRRAVEKRGKKAIEEALLRTNVVSLFW